MGKMTDAAAAASNGASTSTKQRKHAVKHPVVSKKDAKKAAKAAKKAAAAKVATKVGLKSKIAKEAKAAVQAAAAAQAAKPRMRKSMGPVKMTAENSGGGGGEDEVKKRRRSSNGAAAYKEMGHLRNNPRLCMPAAQFRRLVRKNMTSVEADELMMLVSNPRKKAKLDKDENPPRMKPDALHALQSAAENRMHELYLLARQLTFHNGRDTTKPKDVLLASNILRHAWDLPIDDVDPELSDKDANEQKTLALLAAQA